MCTSLAPASRTICTIFWLVVPRTMESSTSTTRLPSIMRRLALCLSLHAHVADRVAGLDEGAADIVVADDAELEGNAGLLGKADRRRRARIGHRHDDVGLDRALERELRADALPDVVDVAALDRRIGPGEIDIFEDAEARLLRLEREQALDALGGDDHHLARLDVAHEAGADDVERAGLGRQDPGAVEVAEHQRPDAERIAHADHLLRRQRHQRVGALDLADRVDEARVEVALAAGGDQVQERLGVGGRREDRALLLQQRAARSARW